MIQVMFLKMLGGVVVRAIEKADDKRIARTHNRKINELTKQYKELSKQYKSLNRTTNKYGKYIEELEKTVAQLKAEAHPPVFTEKQYQDILKRLNNLEKGDTNE
tara:strand:+ start:215 stop:526 length:312 start_codon:yes stop_codon:yes gene_type:complete